MPPDDPPSKPETPFRHLFSEARRRRVLRTLVLYAGGSAAVVEAADVFTGPLALPAGTVRVLAILAVCGLPAVIALAWAYDVVLTPDSAVPAGRRRTPAWGRHSMVVAAVVVSAGSAMALWRRGPAPPPGDSGGPARDPASVAVLPLEFTDGDLEPLAVSLHGRLIDGLSQAALAVTDPDPGRRALRVISRAGVLPFEARLPPDSIGRALDVGTIVSGSVERTPDRVQVRLRLVDAASAEQLGVTVAGAPSGDNLALLEAVADSVTDLLRKSLGDLVRQRLRLAGTGSREALDLLIQGEALTREFEIPLGAGDPATARRLGGQADSLFAAAGRADPAWIEPPVRRALLSDLWALLATASEEPSKDIFERGLEHAERAVSLAPSHPDALYARGSLRHRLARAEGVAPPRRMELEAGAESDLRRAIRGNPRPAAPLRVLAEVLADAGRVEEAYEYGRRSYEEDPYLEGRTPSLLRLFEYSLRLGRDEEAARWCREGMRLGDRLFLFWDCRLQLQAWSEGVQPDPDSAWALVGRELSAYPSPLHPVLRPRLHALAAAVLARTGRADSARAVLSRVLEEEPRTGGMLLAAAGAYGYLGDRDTAYELLERVVEGEPDFRPHLEWAPELRSFRGDVRFRELFSGPRAVPAGSGGDAGAPLR